MSLCPLFIIQKANDINIKDKNNGANTQEGFCFAKLDCYLTVTAISLENHRAVIILEKRYPDMFYTLNSENRSRY